MIKTIAIPVAVLRRGNPDEIADYGDKAMSVDEAEQLASEQAASEAKMAETAYATSRRAEYPSIQDQLDAIWKIVGVTLLIDKAPADAVAVMKTILRVKENHPKPKAETVVK